MAKKGLSKSIEPFFEKIGKLSKIQRILISLAIFVVIAGVFIVTTIPVFWVKLGAAALFLAFGAYTLYGLRKQDAKDGAGNMEDNKGTGDTSNKKESDILKAGGKNGFVSSFSLIFLMELGDKTQIATATLVAGYGHPLVVFAGVLLGLSLLTVLEVKLGSVISKKSGRNEWNSLPE